MPGVRFGPFTLYVDRRLLVREGADVHLTPKAFDLLALLVDKAPAVVSKSELHERLWLRTFVTDSTLVGLMKEVRRALGHHADTLVRTVHGVGYAFCGALQTVEAGQSPSASTQWLTVGGRRIQLQSGLNVIGRDPKALIWLDVPNVSRRHAGITIDGEEARLEDLGSKNGTLLGDRPLRAATLLKDGDRIQIASEVLIFHSASGGVSTATQPPAQNPTRSAT